MLRNLLLTITAIFLSLIAAEVLLYVFHPVYFRAPLERLPNDVWRELLHRRSPISGLSYELSPNREKYSHGAVIKTNSLGMRDDEPQAKNVSLHRIAVLGDSFTFGFGVDGEHTYPAVLERLLNRETDGGRFDVLNFGVGGYSTRDEALVLEHKAVDYNLNLVVVGYYFNDPEIDPIQPVHMYYSETSWWQYSHLSRLIAKAKYHWDLQVHGEGDYFRYLHAPNRSKWNSVVDSLEEIERVAAERKTPVLLVIFPITEDRPWAEYPYRDLHHQITDTASEKGIYVIDLLEDYSQHSGQALMVESDNNHPSKFGHELAANAIYQWIEANRERIVASHSDASER